MNQEEYLAEEFLLLGVKPHITHLKQDPGCAYSVVTVSSPKYETYQDLNAALWAIYLEGSVKRKTGSALDALIIKRFAECGCGVAPCHAGDNFSRKRGRIMSKGRLLKVIRKLRCLSGDSLGDEDVDSAGTDYRDSAERLGR